MVTNKSEVAKKTQEQLAAQMGISVDTLQNYKILSEMISENVIYYKKKVV